MSLAVQVALYGLDQSAEPPDTQLAAGPTQLVEMDNSTLSIWSKSGSRLATADLNAFFLVPTGYNFTDPKVIYDSASSHWFATGLSFDQQNDSHVYLAVSLTSDASGSWYRYLLTNYTNVISDQPKVGVSDDKVVVSWNDYPNASSFSGSETEVLQKSSVLSGSIGTVVLIGPDSSLFSIVPSQSLSSTTTEWLVSNKHDHVAVLAINGTPSQGNVVGTEYDVPKLLRLSYLRMRINHPDPQLIQATIDTGLLFGEMEFSGPVGTIDAFPLATAPPTLVYV